MAFALPLDESGNSWSDSCNIVNLLVEDLPEFCDGNSEINQFEGVDFYQTHSCSPTLVSHVNNSPYSITVRQSNSHFSGDYELTLTVEEDCSLTSFEIPKIVDDTFLFE